MLKLLRLMKGYGKECVLSPLFKMAEALIDLFVPLVVAKIIDVGLADAGGDVGYLLKMCGVMILLGVVGLGFSVTAQYFAAKAASGFTARVRYELFSKIESLSYSQLDSLGASKMITRMTSDANQVQNGVNIALRLLLRSPFVVFGAAIAAMCVDFSSSVIFLSAIVALCAVVFSVMLLTMPLYKKVQGQLDSVVSLTKENLTGVRVIRAFRRERAEEEDFAERTRVLTKIQKFTGGISALMNPATYIVINFAVVWLLHMGSLRIDSGDLTQGMLIALYNYMSQILVELVKLANLIITVTKAAACGNRIESVLELESGEESLRSELPDLDSEYIAELENASLRYEGSPEQSLTGISFKVKRGEKIGIIGSTGSGKTSLINMIAGFYTAEEGEVKVFGKRVETLQREALLERIGVAPQKAALFSGTIRENLLWGKGDATDSELYEALDSAQALNVVSAKGGLDAVIEQGGRNLSGGQRQRLTVARALIGSPDIIILDDSASALDYATDAAMRRAINERYENSAVFIVSQRASGVVSADKIIVLDDGRQVGCGTHEQLLKECDVYREIYYSQYSGEEG